MWQFLLHSGARGAFYEHGNEPLGLNERLGTFLVI